MTRLSDLAGVLLAGKKRSISVTCCFSIEITKGQTHSGFKPHSKTIMLKVLLQLNSYAFCLETSVEKEEEKIHWKPRVKMSLPASTVKNLTY